MPVWINEFHYDNVGTDTGEFVELAGTAGTDLTGWQLVRYNGATPGSAVVYTSPGSISLTGAVIPNTGAGFGVLTFSLPTDGIQNGGNDGFALVDNTGTVVQLLSYEGVFTASNGPAAGKTSVDIGVSETGSTPIGASLGLAGTGSTYADFTWKVFTSNTAGSANAGQTFQAPGITVIISDASVTEGDSGTAILQFTVTRSGALDAFSVNYATADGTAAQPGDYQFAGGTLNFGVGETSKQINVLVNGDTAFEANETLFVNLSGATGGANVTDPQGQGVIINDDVAGPLVTIDDVSLTEGDAGTKTFSFTVTRTGGTGAFTVDFATADGTAQSGSDYLARSGVVSFAAGETSKTIDITVNGDAAAERSETFTVNLSNPTGGASITDGQGVGTIQNDDVFKIHDVQGTAFYSPILAGDAISGFNIASTTQVTVQAVVTAIDATGSLQGFFLAEETLDWDSDSRTSEGVFVMTRNDSGVGVTMSTGQFANLTVGEIVTVTANVMEYQAFATNVPRTFLVNPTIVSQSNTSEPLPTFVIDGTPGHSIPNAILSDDNPQFTDSVDDPGDTFDPQNDALDFLETIEGMRVTIKDAVVADGQVDGSDNFVRFKAYSAVNANADQLNVRGGYTVAGDPPFSPPNTPETDDATNTGGRVLTDGDVNPDILEFDFSQAGVGGTASFATLLTTGDRLGDVSGVIDFDFSNAKLYVTDHTITAASVAGSPVVETVSLAADLRSLRVATFNVENLDPGDDTSVDEGVVGGVGKFNDLGRAVANNLGSPDIISVEEIQDNNGETAGGVDANVTWDRLALAVSTATGHKYQWVDQIPVNNAEGGAPNGNIRVGFLYNTDRVQLGDLPADASLAERRAFTDRIGDGVRDAGDKIAISDDQLGGSLNPADWSGTRKSLLGEFHFNGQTVYVTANHLPSKGGSGSFYQGAQNNAAGQPENAGWTQRTLIADDLHALYEKIAQTNSAAKFVAAGDFNEYYFYRPMEVLTGYVNADGTERVGGLRLDNLTVTELPEAERFTYIFDGRSQAIDHIVVDAQLSGVASYDIVHINTGFNSRAGAVNPALSDHEPAVAQFDFRSFAELLSGGNGADSIDGFAGADSILGGGGDDSLAGGEGADSLVGGQGADTFFGGKGDDRYAGGEGKDVYEFRGGFTGNGADVILDFVVGQDKLRLLDGAKLTKIAFGDFDGNGVRDTLLTLGGTADGTITLMGVSTFTNSILF